MTDVTFERPTGTGDTTLETFEDVEKVMNAPHLDHALVTTNDGEQEKVPCATIVSVDPTDD